MAIEMNRQLPLPMQYITSSEFKPQDQPILQDAQTIQFPIVLKLRLGVAGRMKIGVGRDLCCNDLTGTVPSELGMLTTLQRLYVL